MAEVRDRTRLETLYPDDRSQQCRLAASGWTEHASDLVFRNHHVQVVENPDPSPRNVEVFY